MTLIAQSKTAYQYYLHKFIDALDIEETQAEFGKISKTEAFYRAIIAMGNLYKADINDPMLNALNYMRDALRSDPKHDFIDDALVALKIVSRAQGEMYQKAERSALATAKIWRGKGYIHVQNTVTGANIIAIANAIGKEHWNDTVFTCTEDSPFYANACYLQMCALGLRGSICKSGIVITGKNKLTEGLICPPDALITPNFYQMDIFMDIMEDLFGDP